MNKDHLIKFREQLLKDKKQISNEIDLSQDYVLYLSSELEHGGIYKGEDIVKKKEPASEVVDLIINLYLQRVYAFHCFGYEDLVPVIWIPMDIFYRYDESMLDDDGCFKLSKEKYITLGDLISTNLSYMDEYDLYQEKDSFSCIYGGIAQKENCDLLEKQRINMEKFLEAQMKSILKNKQEYICSFNELLTELTIRGFYCNCNSFEQLEKNKGSGLYISSEPIVLKKQNVK